MEIACICGETNALHGDRMDGTEQRLREYHDHRPNPLMPGELPSLGLEERLK